MENLKLAGLITLMLVIGVVMFNFIIDIMFKSLHLMMTHPLMVLVVGITIFLVLYKLDKHLKK